MTQDVSQTIDVSQIAVAGASGNDSRFGHDVDAQKYAMYVYTCHEKSPSALAQLSDL